MDKHQKKEEIGHIYGDTYDWNSCSGCEAVLRGARTGATVLMLLLLGLLVIVGIAGNGVQINIGGPDVPPARPSVFTNSGGFGGDEPGSLSTLLEHAPNSTVTAEEDAILRSVFSEYDVDGDGYWTYTDFTSFYVATLHSEEAFTFLDSKTGDGVLDYDELVLSLGLMQDMPLLHTDELHDLLVQFTGLPLEDALEEEASVLASAMLASVEGGEDGISEEEFIEFVVSAAWDEYNDDQNTYIDLDEFERDFFSSKTFLTVQACIQDGGCGNLEEFTQAFEDAELTASSRRMLNLYPMESQRRLVVDPISLASLIATIVFGVISAGGTGYGVATSEGACYGHMSMVSVLRDGNVPEMVSINDVDVGDYVWDGSDWTKV